MGRVASVSSGEVIKSDTFGNALIIDYLSQTDTSDQNIASNLVFASGSTESGSYG